MPLRRRVLSTTVCYKKSYHLLSMVDEPHEETSLLISRGAKLNWPWQFQFLTCTILTCITVFALWTTCNRNSIVATITLPEPQRTVAKGLPSYLDYGGKQINATYDSRSLIVNGDRIFLLGGSMHPYRATPQTWSNALDLAVGNKLNLITLYVFWSHHQPLISSSLNWNISVGWELKDAIESCAQRGFFVHVRVGPYNCAEYSYGGIPEWLPIKYPNMQMRRFDEQWMTAMEGFVSQVFEYFTRHGLWAQQGGPILMAQIENEIGAEAGGFMAQDKRPSDSSEKLQEYADWCGKLAARHSPAHTIITMCNGLSARNAILTYNGDYAADLWLEKYGNGRIQVDQPALWTEDEGGFQLWGEDSEHPNDYFWGHTARQMSTLALKWFSRGGTHVNYYMVRYT